MASGLDVASGIAGLISLSITLFQGCVKGFQLVSAARHIGSDADRVRTMLEWEQFRLVQWGERVGFASARTQRNLQLNWALISDMLKQLKFLLTDSESLEKRYNLVTEVGEQVSEVVRPGRKGVGRLWSYVKPEVRTARARIIQERTGPFKKLRWAALDQEKITSLLENISYFNNCLYELLGSQEQDFVQAALSALLRDLVSRTVESPGLDTVKALLDPDHMTDASSISAAASLKQARLTARVDQTDEEMKYDHQFSAATPEATPHKEAARPAPAKLKLTKLRYESLILPSEGRDHISSPRQVGRYRSSKKNINVQVLVEWKQVEKSVETRLRVRIHGLTSMMSNISDPSFHSLKCLGFLQHDIGQDFTLYAYVYEIADLKVERMEPYPEPMVKPLSSLISASNDARLPSLSFRVGLARDLCQTVLQLHTAGWIHKGLNPNNILFIDRGECQWNKGTSLGPFVTGYEYARADNPLEMTEDTPRSAELDIYRHPLAQGIVRPSFSKAFDLYALGCLLLEIAFWQELRTIFFHVESECTAVSSDSLASERSPQEQAHLKAEIIHKCKDRLLDKVKIKPILEHVAFHAGDSYCAAVSLCFHPEKSYADDDDPEASLKTQMSIVQMLSQKSL